MQSYLLQYSSLYDSVFAYNFTALNLAISNMEDLWCGYCSWRKLFQLWHERPGNFRYLLSYVLWHRDFHTGLRWLYCFQLERKNQCFSFCLCVFQRGNIGFNAIDIWHPDTTGPVLCSPTTIDCIGPGIWRFWTSFPSPKGIFNHNSVTLLYFLHTEEIQGVNLTAAAGGCRRWGIRWGTPNHAGHLWVLCSAGLLQTLQQGSLVPLLEARQ